jgi:hypothetical protein
VETITPREIERAYAECHRLQSNEPLIGLLPSDEESPQLRFNEWDWTDQIEPEPDYY